ncbi:MAG: hypothetical protein IPM51_06325 [Sphingobacteriaceae bacterium]|nr:hypothetical protein [Sphingobacteriaceae bacterium]
MINQAILKVESSLKNLGVNPEEAKTDEGQYSIRKDNSTEVLIDVWAQNELVFIQVMSPITINPNAAVLTNLELLLEENHNLVEASFTFLNKTLFVKETYEFNALFTLDRIMQAINRIAFYSQAYTNKWRP